MLDRSVAPPFVKSISFELIRPERTTLDNGLQVVFVPGGSQDVQKIEFVFESGRWYEEYPGAAYFTAQLLSKGTKAKSSFDIAQIFDRYGAHLDVHPGLDFTSVALYTLSKNLSPVLDLLIEILSTPEFPKDELRQTKDVYVQNLRVNLEKTSYVASQTLRKTLFGEKHPYGIEVGEDDVSSLSVENLRDHFARQMKHAWIFVSGKVSDHDKQKMLNAFAQLAGGAPAAPTTHSEHAKPAHQHIKKKDSVQASVRFGGKSVMRSHPDYVPVLFITHILGGYFGSRLMKNIREEKGLTYGISASVHALRNDSFLVIGADVNKENTGLTFGEIRKELALLRSTPVSADELETTRNHFAGSLQSELTTPFAHADKIKTIQLYGLPDDHYQRMISRIHDLTPGDIMAISEKYFREEFYFEVAVG